MSDTAGLDDDKTACHVLVQCDMRCDGRRPTALHTADVYVDGCAVSSTYHMPTLSTETPELDAHAWNALVYLVRTRRRDNTEPLPLARHMRWEFQVFTCTHDDTHKLCVARALTSTMYTNQRAGWPCTQTWQIAPAKGAGFLDEV